MTRREQIGENDRRQSLGGHLHQCARQRGRSSCAGLWGNGEITGNAQAYRCNADPGTVFTESQRRDDGAGADCAKRLFTKPALPSQHEIEHRHCLRDVIRINDGAREGLERARKARVGDVHRVLVRVRDIRGDNGLTEAVNVIQPIHQAREIIEIQQCRRSV